jgi:hypothetical protein
VDLLCTFNAHAAKQQGCASGDKRSSSSDDDDDDDKGGCGVQAVGSPGERWVVHRNGLVSAQEPGWASQLSAALGGQHRRQVVLQEHMPL